MAGVEAPNFAELLAPHLGRVPAEALPRFLALLERGAADRYRHWAGALPAHADVLLACAASEDEIADRVEAVFALDPGLHDAVHGPLPAALAAYVHVFDGLDVWDQLRIQADAERQGARAWRNIAARLDDDRLLAELTACSALEEASADRVDALVARHDAGARADVDVEVVRAIYAAMAARDIQRLLDLLDPAIVVTQDDRLPWGGRHEGHDGFGAFALTLSGAIDSAVTIEAMFTADGDVIQYGRTRGTARATGAPFDIPEVHRWTVRGGRAVAAHFSIDTPAMLRALERTDDAAAGDDDESPRRDG